MPRSLVWACRVFGYAWSFLLTSAAAAHAHNTANLRVLVAGYTVIGLAMAGWAALDLRGDGSALTPTRLAWLTGVICGTAGLLSATRDGTLSILPAGIVTLVAGSECALGQALAVALAGALGAMTGAILSGNSETSLVIGLPACILSGLLLGRQRRAYRVQAVQATELLERTQELQVQQRRADVLDERTRIAREIHDVLAHSLGSLSIQIQAARAVLADDGDRQTVLDVLGDAQRLATTGLAETRRALHALRADAFSLERELRTLAASHEELHGSTVELAVDGSQGELDPAAAMTLLRVAQESLVNAAKHAPEAAVRLRLTYDETQVRLVATNPLASSSPSARTLSTADSGYGLPGMRERLLLAGGTLEAGPCDGGWRVEAVLPREAAAGTEHSADDDPQDPRNPQDPQDQDSRDQDPQDPRNPLPSPSLAEGTHA